MDGNNQNHDFEGARGFDRQRVRRDAESAFEEDGAPVYSHREVAGDAGDETSLKALIGEAMAQGKRLIRAEWRLARTELKREAAKAGAGTGMLVAGATFGLLAAMTLVAMFVAALVPVMKLWVACLVVGLGLLLGAGLLAMSGLKAIKNVKPDKTINSLKEDKAWASETLRAAKRQTHGHA